MFVKRCSSSSVPESPEPAKRHKNCQRCHSHKIKCSGDQPCSKCIQVGHGDDCKYFFRDRKVKVSESYLQQLLAEIRHLRAQPSGSRTVAEGSIGDTNTADASRPVEATNENDEIDTNIRNHFVGDHAWSHPYNPSTPPIYIGEAACTAFATRLRRFLTNNNTTPHITRTQYVKDAIIVAAIEADVQWPSLQEAQLLVKMAIYQVGPLYHMVLCKSTLDKLEEIYRTGAFDCPVNKGKYFSLFAFGEAYSVRSEPSTGSVPGTSYFAKALSLVQISPERTSIIHLETLLLLSLFSYFLNRRHLACVLSGNAMRLSLNIGLNHNIPDSQLIDPVARQHRVRIWWTIYIFDRMWGSKMGLPMQISDEDIHVDMPSDIAPLELHNKHFTDTQYIIATIKLARIAGETITKLYSRKKYGETFLQRVQGLLKALKNWVQTLPEHVSLNPDEESNKKHIVSLHLSFNQCVILVTRPTMLYTLSKLSENGSLPVRDSDSNLDSISQSVLTLGRACIQAARHSHSLILEKWMNCSLPVFGYFHSQYLFSSAMVLAVSSLIPMGSPSDRHSFEMALKLLYSIAGNGNLTASEFYPHLNQIKICLDDYLEKNRAGGISISEGAAVIRPDASTTAAHTAIATTTPFTITTTTITRPSLNVPAPNDGVAWTTETNSSGSSDNNIIINASGSSSVPNAKLLTPEHAPNGYTTEMAFLEPTMQDFLAQSDYALGFPHPVDSFMNDADSIYAYLTPMMLTE